MYNQSHSTVSRGLCALDLTYIAVSAVLIAICSWISIPTTVPFTLQTMCIFLVLGLLGGFRGTISIILYVLMGMVGIPVFAGFSGGFAVLLSPTGGYIIGFIAAALIYWCITARFGSGTVSMIFGMILGQLVCYAFGTAWFMVVYARTSGAVGLMTALGWCVFPFLAADGAKIVLAYLLTRRLAPHLKGAAHG